MSSNNWFVKMKPLLGLTGMGGGGAGLTLGGGAVPFIASGGDQNGITPGNGWKYHTFYTVGPGTFTVTQGVTSCKVLVLGGGGGGAQAGSGPGGGAGAGGLVYHDAWEFEPGTYDVEVGTKGAGNSGGPATPGDGGSPRVGGMGGPSIFSSPTFTCTALGGHAGNNTPGFPGTQTAGCGMGGGGYSWNNETNVSGMQNTQAQPGVPAGYVNHGHPGGWGMNQYPLISHTPIIVGPHVTPLAHPGLPGLYPGTGDGGGGGCGMAGIGYSMAKFTPPATPAPQPGNWQDLMMGTGGNGWAGPPVFNIPDVFGPNAPTVSGHSPTNNVYGGGGGATIGQKGTFNVPATTWPSAPGQGGPGMWSPNYNMSNHANMGGYGGGGYGLDPSYGAPDNSAHRWPWFGPRKHGIDKLGGGGATQDYFWPGHPTHPAAGDGGSGLVVIAYYEDVSGAPSGTAVPVALWGGGGGGGEGPGAGGGGGYYNGTLNLLPGDYTFCVGSGGATLGDPEADGNSGYGGAPVASGNGGGGGGYSGFFRGDFTPTGTPIPMKGMTQSGSAPGSTPGGIGNQWYMGPGDAANYKDLNLLQQHAIFMVGGGGACAESPAGGGGGGGYDNGDPGREPTQTWPFPGAGQGGTNSPEYGGKGGYGGGGGAGDVGYGRPGQALMGGYIGEVNHGGGPGGGGFWGGGEGGAQSGASNTELGGGGSGHIDPAWVSPGASGELGNPGIASPNPAYAGGQSDPMYPGTAGQGGAGPTNTGVTAGSVVFGPHSGTLAVTPPGGSPASVPSSGQAFDTAGEYKLTVS